MGFYYTIIYILKFPDMFLYVAILERLKTMTFFTMEKMLMGYFNFIIITDCSLACAGYGKAADQILLFKILQPPVYSCKVKAASKTQAYIFRAHGKRS